MTAAAKSARVCGCEPWAYLRDVLQRLPTHSTAASRTYSASLAGHLKPLIAYLKVGRLDAHLQTTT